MTIRELMDNLCEYDPEKQVVITIHQGLYTTYYEAIHFDNVEPNTDYFNIDLGPMLSKVKR